jgi:hypothetical protein
MGVSEQPVGFRIFLGKEIVTVHCIFDENIPSRDEEYFKEIDEIFKIRVSPKERKAEDFYYLIGLQHKDDKDGLLYETTRISVRKGKIVAYRRAVSESMTTSEEKQPIHVQDIANLTASWILKNPVIDGTDRSVPTSQNLEEIGEGEYPEERDLQDISISLSDDQVVEPATLKEAKLLPERKQWLDGARLEIKKLEKRKCWIKKYKVRLVAKGFSPEE